MKQSNVSALQLEEASSMALNASLRQLAIAFKKAPFKFLFPVLFFGLSLAVPFNANANSTPRNTNLAAEMASLNADLALVKTVNDNTPDQNQVVTFTLVVSNAGTDNATNFEVTDVVPTGMTYVAGSMTGPGTYVNGAPSTTGLKWQNLFLQNGGSLVLTFQATVTAAGGTVITNFAQVTASAEDDPDSTPNNGNVGEDDGDIETVTVNVVNPPVVLTCPVNTTAAACQTQAAVNTAFATWLATASGTGGCNGVLTNNNTGAPPACGGSTTVTFTYTSTCAPLTTTCQATFVVSAPASPTPVFANCTNNTVNLGCNPFNLPSCTAIASGGFGGAVTASNSCGTVPVNCIAGPITINGCTRTQIFTFEATACGQTATCTRTFTWNVVTPPTFNGTCGNGVVNLGCNPVNLPACDPNVTASNECGPITVVCQVGAITSNGCNRSQTLTYVANATGCGMFSTCTRIFNWQVSTSPVVFANCDNTIDLGCNPATLPSCANINQAGFGGQITASNDCGNIANISCSAGTITVNGCNRTQVFTITATPTCGPAGTCTRTFTWQVATAPVFANCTTGTTDLGCNPATLPSCDPGVTASSECGPATVVCTAGTITSNGCNRTQVFTYVATGACGLTSTCTRTFTWKVSTSPIVFTNCDNTIDLGCNPATLPSCAVLFQQAFGGQVQASNDCGAVTVFGCSDGPITVNGCNRTQVFTLTPVVDCGPVTTCTRTFTWKIASTPTFDNCTSGFTDLGCNPATLPSCDPGVTATGECGPATVVCTPGTITSNGCNRQQIFTYVATDPCGQMNTCTRTFGWTVTQGASLTIPINTTTPACQTQAAVDAAFASWLATASFTGGCNAVLTNNNTGAPPACGGSTTVTFTVTNGCGPGNNGQATFTVASETPLVIICPTNTTVAACQTQAAIDQAYSNWINTANTNGGCNVTGSNNGNFSPSSCGEVKTVTFEAFSTCAPLTQTCQATFTVSAPPPVILTCPTNQTEPFGQTQAQINAAFNTWLGTVSASGGCNGVLTNNNTGAPPATGGTTTVTFTYTSSCAPLTTTCQATFAVSSTPPVVLTCPTNTTVAACQTQAAVNAAFNTWLATASGTGGCNGILTNNNTGAPSACGGSTTVTFTYTSTCAPLTTTCQATFTVAAAPPSNLGIMVGTTNYPSCQTQATVNATFATWLSNNAIGTGGCNGVLTNNNTGAPSACGGSTTVTWTYTTSCAQPLTAQATFTVAAPPTVVLTCPINTTVAACQTQAAVNSAFATWLATASASGGCNGVLTNNNTGAPSACGGSTTVTFTYTSSCAPLTTTCQATFTVPAAPTVVLTCPTNTTAAACQTQAAVNTAFATWLATASASGGCNGVLTNNNTGAPSACGGSTTVTFTYTSSCAPLTTTCQATFTVASSPVVLTCPMNTTTAACQTQAAVNTAFATWLATASASGGCNGVLTNNNTGAPSACGGSTTVTFTYTSSCAPLTTTCQATFTVPAAPTVVLTCPTNTTAAACQTQAAVNSAFATWLATASASGGCNGVLTNNNTGAPSACGGSTTVTFTYTSSCAPLTTTCQATFTVASSPVVLTCPTNTTTAACQTQAAVNTAFATWLATASASGGCNGVLTNNNTGAPSACGGSTTVTFTYTSSCAPLTTTCQATFTVPAAPTVVLTCPVNTTTAACQTQAAVNTAFATWLATASASGGCNGVLTNNNTGAPSACGGSTTVTFTYTSSCAPLTTTCQATFTVPAAPTVVLTCPVNTTTAACQTQAAVNTAFATWLATASASGGCNGVLTNNNTGAPSACGGSTTVTFTYTSSCAPLTTTCQATFTVPAAPTVVLTCPVNTTTAACQTQAAVNTAFATWLATASASGGCNGVLTNNNTGAPSACGGSTTVIFTYTSSCAPTTTTCQATFTVPAAPTVVLTCPTNTTAAACQTQAAVNTAFATWLATASASGGCNGVLTNNNTGAPSACGGSTTVTFTYTSSCAPFTTTCTATFTVAAAPTVVLTCPTNTTAAACQTQAQVDQAFATWLATASASGGCNGVLTNNNTGAPSACGGSTTVTFTYTSSCAPLTTTCQATFTVAAPPTVVLTCPTNTTAAACQTQAQVDQAFATWLATASASGGCNGVLTNNNTGAPSACGGSTTVTFTYTSSCAPTTTTCQATFTVAAPPTVVLTCPTPTTASACLTQAQLDAAYSAWLASATASGGCNGVLTNNSQGTPSICSATAVTRTVTFTYTSSCAPTTTTCTSTFTVPAYPTFTVPANGAATVACPANATQPTPPTVVDGCGNTLTPAGPTITNVPNPLTCEGTRTYAWTYTDCAGLVRTWSFVYTIERLPFTVPANGSATVACPANATQPTPPTVTSNCGEVLTPVGPVVTNVPNPLTCEGTRTYAWTYTDCEGNTATWSFTYTIERQPFTVPANGSATVACPDQTDVQPTPPTVTSNCGEVLTPVITSTQKPGCEGNRIYYFNYTDCEGNTATWLFTYTVEYLPFTVPASETMTVNCPASATQPTPPAVLDNCGKPIAPVGPAITGTDNNQGCEASRVYTWTYRDCEGNTQVWSKTYLINYTGDFFPPADETFEVSCLLYAQPPLPQTLYDNCGQEIAVTGPVVEGSDNGCSGQRKYTYIYTDCAGNSHPWSFTYIANDNEPPVGQCPNVDVTDLACIDDVPCPDDYDFELKIKELLDEGGIYDVCSGDDLKVTLDSWTDLWECSDDDEDGNFTFGRTFYFRIADACGNELPSLCGVTYSGNCLPIETFPQNAWGIPGGEPGTESGENDLQVIAGLLQQGPIVIGGNSRSLTVNDAQCVVNLLPGTAGPGVLANCHQVNCTGCNPLGIGGMKNSLAANAIALNLNIRYNVQYNGLTLNALRNQRLDCIDFPQSLLYCPPTGGPCVLRIIENPGIARDFPNTIGGLLDMANLFLNGGLNLTKGQSIAYASALNAALARVNAYWNGSTVLANLCNEAANEPGGSDEKAQVPTAAATQDKAMSLAPNPAGSFVTISLEPLEEEREAVLEIYNQFGQLVLRKDLGVIGQLNDRIDIRSFNAGVYYVSLMVGGERFEQRLLVSKG